MHRATAGANSPATSLELQLTLQQLDFLIQQIHKPDKAIRTAVTQTQTPIMSIPGIGPTPAAIILAEIGDIGRFSPPDKLQAFAGLDPATYHSGKFKADRTPRVKCGSTHLRRALMQAARLAAVHCEMFSRYRAAKQAQGKHYFVALAHTAKKPIRVIFHILNTNEDFSLRRNWVHLPLPRLVPDGSGLFSMHYCQGSLLLATTLLFLICRLTSYSQSYG
jgi:transposase